MTLINLHGILAAEFKKHFSLAIRKPKEVFDAIACNYPNFKSRMAELAQQGIHYTLVINGERIQDINELNINRSPDTIDIVPVVCGAGKAGMAIAIIAIGVLTAGVGAAAAAGAAWAATAGITASMGSFMLSAGVAIAGMGLQMMLAPKPDMQRAESTVSAAKQSFNFSSKANVAEQGIPVPVGYGRLRIGSAVIQSTIKSYPSSYNIDNALGNTLNGEQPSSANNNK